MARMQEPGYFFTSKSKSYLQLPHLSPIIRRTAYYMMSFSQNTPSEAVDPLKAIWHIYIYFLIINGNKPK